MNITVNNWFFSTKMTVCAAIQDETGQWNALDNTCVDIDQGKSGTVVVNKPANGLLLRQWPTVFGAKDIGFTRLVEGMNTMDVLWFAAGSQAEPFGGTGIYAWWRALGPVD